MKSPRIGLAGRSLRSRLLASAAVFILLAILATGWVMSDLLDRFVRGEIAGRLDLQIATIGAEIGRPRPPGGGRRARDVPRPPFEGPPAGRGRVGWYWQIEEPDGDIIAAPELGDARLPAVDTEREPRGPPNRLIELEGPNDQRLVARTGEFPTPDGVARVIATAPEAAIRGPLRDAALTIALTLSLLGAGLAAAIVVQVRFALSPLDRLRRMLTDVRAGRRERIEGPQPLELQPLTDELNALIDHDAEILRQARRHVANLAHGLKTPLATLAAQAARLSDEATRREWEALTELMDRRIRHHLRRARSAAQGGPMRHRTSVLTHAQDLSAMLTKFGSGSAIEISVSVDPEIAVAIDGEDLDEMLGNLLENACRHARSRVSIDAGREGRLVLVTIADDGPGLTEDEIRRVLKPGARLDETLPGHGFGLPITSEIAELYGGSLRLQRGGLGGLETTLALPAPVDAS